ncbi:hypothetical protein HDE_06192 [Halotydeus destructor]|nr:hypothetical protein HDE_06192 [Halotydeus destructor]
MLALFTVLVVVSSCSATSIQQAEYQGCWSDKVCLQRTPGAAAGIAAAATCDISCSDELYAAGLECSKRLSNMSDPVDTVRLACYNLDKLLECYQSKGQLDNWIEASVATCQLSDDITPFERPKVSCGCLLDAWCPRPDRADLLRQQRLLASEYKVMAEAICCDYYATGYIEENETMDRYCDHGLQETDRQDRIWASCMRLFNIEEYIISAISSIDC